MLDKSVPYAGFFMRREPGEPVPDFLLPEGFRFAFFSNGDEASWTKIETSALEFDSEFKALMFFKERFLPYTDELKRRCLFIENTNGKKIATATAWWSEINGQRRPWIQWVAVDPRYQGQGLGKAIISKATGLMIEIEGEVPLFLKTQTWSYKAVDIYKKCGFEPTDEKTLYRERANNYKKAMRILKRLSKNRSTNEEVC